MTAREATELSKSSPQRKQRLEQVFGAIRKVADSGGYATYYTNPLDTACISELRARGFEVVPELQGYYTIRWPKETPTTPAPTPSGKHCPQNAGYDHEWIREDRVGYEVFKCKCCGVEVDADAYL